MQFLIGDHPMHELSAATDERQFQQARRAQAELPFTGERMVTTIATESVIEHLHRYGLAIDLCDGRVVLDIASGEGYGSWLLARRSLRVYGVDISSEAVEHARTKYRRRTCGISRAAPTLSR